MSVIKNIVLAIVATTSMCMAFSANAENGLATQSSGNQINADGNLIGYGILLDYRGGKVLWASGNEIFISDKTGQNQEKIVDLLGACSNGGVNSGIYTGNKNAVIVCTGNQKVLKIEDGQISDLVAGQNWAYPVSIAFSNGKFYISRFELADIVSVENGNVEIVYEGYYYMDALDVFGENEFLHEQTYPPPYKNIKNTKNWSNGVYFGDELSSVFGISAKEDKVLVTGSDIYNLISTKEYSYEGTLIRVIGTNFANAKYEKQAITPPTPPPEPVQSVINGLTCDEVIIPDPVNAVWNTDFGKLPLYSTSSGTEANGEKWIQTTSVSNDKRSFDTVRLQNIGDGSDLPIGSIGYPGNDYANVNLNNSADTSITVQSKRDGALAKWNLLQFHGVNQQGFQSWSASSVVRVGGQYLEGQGLSATGGVATLAVAGNNLTDTASIFTPVSGFSGIRIGYATPTKKKYCSAQSNKCEWSYEGGSLLCQGVPTADGLVSGSCGIAGSGSIYGSGSCVPLTNTSGSVVEVDLPGSYTIVQNPDGTTTKVKAGTVGQAGSIFACKITGETWYERIGQYIACPFTQILPNLWNYMTSPIKDLSKGATSVSTSGNGGVGLVGTGAEQSDNQVIISIKNAIETWTGDNQHPINRYVFLVVALVAILLIVAMVALVVSVIKE